VADFTCRGPKFKIELESDDETNKKHTQAAAILGMPEQLEDPLAMSCLVYSRNEQRIREALFN
jgi:hypothetical protein